MLLPYDSNIWFSPRYAVQYFAKIFTNKGKKAITSPLYQKEREAWIMGITLFGVMKLFGEKWWLQVPQDDPPDMRAMTIVPNTKLGINEMHHREIELMQITKHTKGSIEEEIIRKLKDKYYIPKTGLVVYLNRTTTITDMRIISKRIKKEKLLISDIWVMGSIAEDSPEHILFRIHPDVLVIKYNIHDEIAKSEAGDMIEMTFSKGIEMEFKPNQDLREFIPK